MTAFSDLSDDLQTFRALAHHSNPALAGKLAQVQAWQRDRMRRTHAELFSQPQNQPMADYFLNNLYGGEAFEILVRQLERIVPKAKKLEKLAPSSALETGVLAIRAAVTATQLDLDLAQWLLENDLAVTEQNMLNAYRTVDAQTQRLAQINDLKAVCYGTDKHLNSFILRKAFKLAKGQAYKNNYQHLYDFIDAGFSAMIPLKSVTRFIEPFCEQEMAIIAQVHAPKSECQLDKRSGFAAKP